MRAIIPAAGAGTKLRPHTYTQPKSLIPVAGKPILGFIIEQLQQVGIREFVIVIGYLGEKIRDYVQKYYPEIEVTYVIQNSREGLGHAIWQCRKAIPEGEEVIIVLGDTVLEVDMAQFMAIPGTVLGIKKVSDPRLFGVAEFSEDGRITRVTEKPTIPKSNMAIVGLYKIKEFDTLMEVLQYNIKHRRKPAGEYFLTDGLQGMLEKGVKMTGYKVDNWYDCGQKEVLLQTNALLLKSRQEKGHLKSSGEQQNSIIVPPVYIGEGAVIKNSIIGPNVTIGDHTQVQNAIIRDSIIGSFTRLKEIILYASIVGSDSNITGSGQSLNIGDNTELDLR